MVRTEIGECSFTYNDIKYEFRPSFKNIRKICSPSYLANFYSDLAGMIEGKMSVAITLGMVDAVKSYSNEIRQKSAIVLDSCCDTDCKYILDDEKIIPTNVMQQLALSLLTHGLIGVDKGSEKAPKEKRSDIDVYEYADIAEAHLGIQYPLSENLTKTELDRKMRVKFPPEPATSNSAPSDDEYHKAMEMLDRIESKRAK